METITNLIFDEKQDISVSFKTLRALLDVESRPTFLRGPGARLTKLTHSGYAKDRIYPNFDKITAVLNPTGCFQTDCGRSFDRVDLALFASPFP